MFKGSMGLRSRAQKGEKGFTLVELLVVVGIIVALAAVIFPNVTKFATKGDEGGMAAEKASVQAAMDTMMADKSILAVTASVALAAGTNTWTALPAGTGAVALSGYLQNDTTTYYYCWDGTGKIVDQGDSTLTCP